ncbi:MAG: MATE family efflux transporter [Pseudomonadota bacterium]
MSDATNPAAATRAEALRPWRAETRALLSLGAPMAATQLIQFSVQTVDLLMIGRLGAEPLAASSIGLVFFYFAFLLGFGPAMAVSPLVSQTLGANPDDVRDVRRSVRMALWSIVLAFPVVGMFFLLSPVIIRGFGQPEALATLATPYVLALAPGWPFMIAVLALRNFLAAIDRTRVPLYIIIATTALNALLNYVFIFGAFGAPRLELVGAGIASSLSHAAGFAALVVYIQRDAAARRFALFVRLMTPDWERLREVFVLGWPISVTTGFEAMLFNACVLIMGRIGVNEVAAYQIALNVAAIAFMGPFGLSMAGATRVGLAHGAGDAARVRRAAAVTILASVALISVFAVASTTVPRVIAGFYLDRADPANAELVRLIAAFLPIAGAFMLFDAVQVAANQCLRGLKDVDRPMILTGISYWAVGFPAAYGLGLHTELGARGVWVGLLLALLCASILLGARLHRLTRA